MAFLDGAPPERLCEPMVEHIRSLGGEVHLDSPLREIKLNPDGSVAAFHIGGVKGKESFDLTADAYVSALPVDPFKLLLPEPWKQMEVFQKLGWTARGARDQPAPLVRSQAHRHRPPAFQPLSTASACMPT